MPLKTSKYIWHEGKLVPWEQATVHVLSHALHYGSSVFEGIRVYATPKGAVGFRLTDHIRRLFHSAKIYRMKIPFTSDALVGACRDVVRENDLLQGRLHPADCVPRLWRDGRRRQHRAAGERLGRRLGMGLVSRRARSRAGRRRLRLVVAARGAEHGAGAGQGRRQLSVERARDARGAPPRVRRRPRAEHGGLRQRRRRREPVPRAERQAVHAADRVVDPVGPHARQRDQARAVRGARGRRAEHSARAAVHRRRGVLDGHRRRDHARALGRQDPGRRRQARPDHGASAEAVLRPVRRQHGGPLRLARADRRAGRPARIERPKAV